MFIFFIRNFNLLIFLVPSFCLTSDIFYFRASGVPSLQNDQASRLSDYIRDELMDESNTYYLYEKSALLYGFCQSDGNWNFGIKVC